MNIKVFTHSLRSDWNHGNAHFMRGVVTELQSRGHQIEAWEPRHSWSAENLQLESAGALDAFRAVYPDLPVRLYDAASPDLEAMLQNADLVLVHEWNAPDLVAQIGRRRAAAPWKLLFHDTHHRAVTAAHEMAAFDLSHYDGVLAFGNVIRDLYVRNRWAKRAWTWHEAADTRVFRPLENVEKTGDLVWIGNWGDDERSAELNEFLIEPVAQLQLDATIHGVRYPPDALAKLKKANIQYGGYLPNFRAPETFARHRVTVHVPRRPYVEALPGIPTIRPFEALACGIPLVSAPWHDAENLFRVGRDFLVARDGAAMKQQLRAVLNEPELRQRLVQSGLETIRARHTCGHRADELLQIASEL